jgi:hypothetical protein
MLAMGAVSIDKSGESFILWNHVKIGFFQAGFFKVIKRTCYHAIVAARTLLRIIYQYFLV